jgi:L-serine dehydratase
MRAACRFVQGLTAHSLLDRVARVQVDLYGSLALTGLGHATDRAVLLGLAGNEPAGIDPAAIDLTVKEIRVNRRINLAGSLAIHFDEINDLQFHRDIMFPQVQRRSIPMDLESPLLARRVK